jgi:DNA-binding MarR family transcriptional regulator
VPDHELTLNRPALLETLAAVGELGSCTTADLMTRLGRRRSSVYSQVTDLLAYGLIASSKKNESVRNRPANEFELTAKGRSALEEAASRRRAQADRLMRFA